MKNLDDEALEEVAGYFYALSVPMRLKILAALTDGELNVSELTAATESTQANISKHLAVLAQRGLVGKTARGTSIYYRITGPRVNELCALVCGELGRHHGKHAERRHLFVAAAAAGRKSRKG